jgi:DUF1365 family protein
MKAPRFFSAPAIMVGEVVHQRVAPLRHRLKYRVFSLLVDLDRLKELNRRSGLFSLNRFNLLSLHTGDLAGGAAADLAGHARALVRERVGLDDIASVHLLTFPRVLGYVFNPLSIYFCQDGGGRIAALIYEVRNTFGGMTSYVSAVNDDRIEGAAKTMAVSPFNDETGQYDFALSARGDVLTMAVSLRVAGKPLINTWHTAVARPFSTWRILAVTAAMPLMTLKVIAAIHLEALKLWLKGLRPPRRNTSAQQPPHPATPPTPAE